jgi:phage/plasmid-like protein (TIGR03299 family)
MAHQIQTEGVRKDLVLIEGDKGWHGLGQDRVTITAEDIRREFFPMDWQMEDAMLANGNPVEGWKAVTSEGHAVGMVGEKYTMLQMSDVLAVAEDICLAHGTGRIVSAGTLHGREDFFLDLDIGKEFRHKDDVSKSFIGLSNNAVGSRHFLGGAHSYRIVCANTLNLAFQDMKGSPRCVKIRHSKGAHNRLQEAKRILGVSVAAFDAADAEMHAMIAATLTESQVNGYYGQIMPILPIPAKEERQTAEDFDAAVEKAERANRKTVKVREEWWNTLDNERKILRVDSPNLWLAMNSVTKWAQQDRTVRGESADSVLRLWSNRFGDGYDRTNEAHDVAVAMLTA